MEERKKGKKKSFDKKTFLLLLFTSFPLNSFFMFLMKCHFADTIDIIYHSFIGKRKSERKIDGKSQVGGSDVTDISSIIRIKKKPLNFFSNIKSFFFNSRLQHRDSNKMSSSASDTSGLSLLPANVSLQGARRRSRLQLLQRLPLRPSLRLRPEKR